MYAIFDNFKGTVDVYTDLSDVAGELKIGPKTLKAWLNREGAGHSLLFIKDQRVVTKNVTIHKSKRGRK